jgi:hypothetical protein
VIDDWNRCIGIATSNSGADGPYTSPPGAGTIVCQNGESLASIDPSVFHDPVSENDYLMWASFPDRGIPPKTVWSQKLDPATTGTAVTGQPKPIISGEPNTWEDGDGAGGDGGTAENPAMWYHGGVYWLFYSGNYWNTQYYAEGYAICDGPRSSTCSKHPGPFLVSPDVSVGQ